MTLYPNELVIDDDTNNDLLFRYKVDGEVCATGAVPRDYSVQPIEMLAAPSEMKLIPRSEWSDRIKEQEKLRSRTSDLLLNAGIPSLNQSNVPYCWVFSSALAVIIDRLKSGQAYEKLSPCAVGAIIKGGRAQGGWSALSAQWIAENGIPTEEFWPPLSLSLKHDTPEMRANAARHKITEDWVDLGRSVYDRNLTFDQVATCLLQNIPVAVDMHWWSHAICACDLVEVEPGSFGIRIRNSWSDSYGSKGFAVLQGRKAIPDGAIAVRATKGSGQ